MRVSNLLKILVLKYLCHLSFKFKIIFDFHSPLILFLDIEEVSRLLWYLRTLLRCIRVYAAWTAGVFILVLAMKIFSWFTIVFSAAVMEYCWSSQKATHMCYYLGDTFHWAINLARNIRFHHLVVSIPAMSLLIGDLCIPPCFSHGLGCFSPLQDQLCVHPLRFTIHFS